MAFKIALSAGHHRGNSAKKCLVDIDPNETREWVLNDRICRKIEEKLKDYSGYSLFRVDDVTGKRNVTLTERSNKANAEGADLYLAIHHNAGIKGGAGGGVVAYVYTKPSDESVDWQKKLYAEIINETGLRGNRSDPLPKANFHECREPNMPAVLLECGFMDSTVDTPIILTEEFADKVATACVSVIATKAKLTPKKTTSANTPAEVKVGDTIRLSNGTVSYKVDNITTVSGVKVIKVADIQTFTPYKVRVNTAELNIRLGAGTNTKKVGTVHSGDVYTIVGESAGKGSTNGWGKLKSGAGWISLDYCKKLN